MAGVSSSDWTWAVKFGDLDNDGWIDLFTTNGIPRFDMNPDLMQQLEGAPRQLQVAMARRIPPLPEANLALRNTGDLAFEPVSTAWGLGDTGVSQGAAYADLDRDGDLDLVVNNLGSAWLYRNRGNGGSSVLVALRGVRSNRLGLGARVTVETEAGSQVRELTLSRGFLSSDEPVLHFGLGDAKSIRKLHVRWPSGVVQEYEDLAVDRSYVVTKPTAMIRRRPRLGSRQRQRHRLWLRRRLRRCQPGRKRRSVENSAPADPSAKGTLRAQAHAETESALGRLPELSAVGLRLYMSFLPPARGRHLRRAAS